MTTSKKRNQKRLLKCGLLAAFLVIPAGVAAACGSPASLKYMTMVAKWDKMFSFQNENSEPAYLRNTSVKTATSSSGSSSSSSGSSTTTNQTADTTASTTLKYLKNAASGETPINELYAYDGTKSEQLTTATAAGAALNNIYSVLAQTFAYSLAAPAATYAAAVDADQISKDSASSTWMFPVNATTSGTTTTDGKNDVATLKDFYRAVANNLFVANSDTNIGFAVTDVSFSFKLIDDASSGSNTGTTTDISNLSAKATTSTQTEAATTTSGTTSTNQYSLITSLGSPFDARAAFTSKALTTIDSKIKTKDKNEPQNPTSSDTSTTTTAYSDVDAQGWLTKTYLIDDASVYFRFYLAGSDKGTGLPAYPDRTTDIVQGAGGTSNSDATVDQVWNNAYGTKDKPSKPSAYAFKLQFNPLVAIMPYQILRAPETTTDASGSTTTPTPSTTTDSTPQYSLQPLAVTGVYPLELIKAEGLTSELLKVTQKVDAMMTVEQTTQFNTMSALAQADFSAFSGALTTTALRTASESTSAAKYKPTGNINDSKTKTNTMREWFKWYFKGVYGLSPVNETDKPFDPQPGTTSTPTT